jgi:[ribosomal protein S5]-alanine N-acetyltransferase
LKIVIETERLRLALPSPDAAPLLVRHYTENRGHRERWDPPRPHGFFTEPWWRVALRRAQREFAARASIKLVLLAGETVAGTCNFTQVVKGECRLGYGLDRRFEGKGYMSEALRAAIPFAFERLRVERIRASYLPENERSARLLERLGFTSRGPERQLVGRTVVVHDGVELVRGAVGTREAHGAHQESEGVREPDTTG